MISLRPYQENHIRSIREAMKQGHKQIVAQLPTGGGKTVEFSCIVKNASEKGNKCLIVSNRCELLEQTGGTFDRIGLTYSNVVAGENKVPTSRISIAMVETLKRRLKTRLDFQMWFKSVNVIIIDEAHLCAFNDIFAYAGEDAIILGFTATPIRFGKMPELSDFFSAIVIGESIKNLITTGYLSKAKYFGVPVDVSNVKIKAGEFDEAGLQEIYTSSEVFGGLKDNLLKHGNGRKTIIFCPTIETSKKVAAEIGCLHVDGEMSLSNRTTVLDKFHVDPSGIISNVGILTTGYDHPPVSRIVLYRATKSLPLYLQMCGRGSRIFEGKDDFIVLDFGNNILRHNFWHTERVWKLENDKKKKKKSDKEGVYPIKDCPHCGYMVAVNTKTCPECGYEWKKDEKEQRIIELQEMSYRSVMQQLSNASIEEMEAIRQAKGYKIGFLLHQFKRFEQFVEYGRFKNYHPNWAKIQANKYGLI